MKKTKKQKIIFLTSVLALAPFGLQAQDSGDRITVPFRDASRPRTVVVNLIQGSITIHAYNGNDVIVEGSHVAPRRRDGDHGGMHQIYPPGGMEITEDNNVITIHGDIIHSSNITVQVPVQTSLKLKTVNGGKISVDGVSGDIEADNTNGSVIITDCSGSVVASSTNGKVTVSLNRVTPNKSMSFSTMNGTVDVTLPADTKANLRMRTDNGEIWSDFEVKLEGTRSTQDQTSRNGHRIRIDKTVYGTINGGGPEIQMVSFNGTIYLRKK